MLEYEITFWVIFTVARKIYLRGIDWKCFPEIYFARKLTIPEIMILRNYDFRQFIFPCIVSCCCASRQCIIHQKNLQHRSITTFKYIKIRQPRPQIEGVSKLPLTVKHPVVQKGQNTQKSQKKQGKCYKIFSKNLFQNIKNSSKNHCQIKSSISLHVSRNSIRFEPCWA